MKKHKAPGLSGLAAEMIQAAEDTGTQWILDLCNSIVKERCIPEDWKYSVVLPIFKGKGDPMECGSYRRIKLLEHAMKVVERIFDHRIRQQVEIDDMQFGFVKGKGTNDAIFIARQMRAKFRVKGKKLYFGFVDLEKAFDRVPREVIRWAMHKLGVEEWLIAAVMSMYTGAKAAVKTNGVKLKDRVSNKELRERLRIVDVTSLLQQNRLRWYGHVLRKDDNDWLKKCMEYEVVGSRPRGRPKRTWLEFVQRDCHFAKYVD